MRQKRAGHLRGFTLLEILIVLVIVGILATLAVLSVSGKSQQARMTTAANRVEQVFRLAGDEAIVRNLQLGVRVSDHSYSFVQLNDQHQWVAYTNAAALRAHHVEPDITLQVFTHGLSAKKLSNKKDKADRPQAVFLSSGEATPFRLEIHADGAPRYYQVSVDLNGDISSEQKGANS